MKKLIIGYVLFFTITLTSGAKAGGWSSGGGDDVAAQFVSVGYDVYRYLNWLDDTRRAELGVKSLYSFQQLLLETKVRSQDHVYLDGIEVNAQNDPINKEIIVNRSRFALMDKEDVKASHILHEYLSVAKIDDGNYRYSHNLIGAYQTMGKLNPPMPTFRNSVVLDLPTQTNPLPDDFEKRMEEKLQSQSLYYFGGSFSLVASGTILLDDFKLISENLSLSASSGEEYIAKTFGVQRHGCLGNAIWNFAQDYKQIYGVKGKLVSMSQLGDTYHIDIAPETFYISYSFEQKMKKFLPHLRELAILWRAECGG